MPAPIYLPGNDPFAKMLPMMFQVLQQKQANKNITARQEADRQWQAQQQEEQRAYAKSRLEEERDYDLALLEANRKNVPGVAEGFVPMFVNGKWVVKAKPKGEKPLKSLERIQAEAAARAKGTALGKPPEATQADKPGKGLTGINKEFFDLYGRKAKDTDELRKFKIATTPPTEKELALGKRVKALPLIQELASKDPNEAYKRGWKMNPDGTVFTELDTGAPVRLPEFHKATGKRGMVKAMKATGEQWDDAKQVMALLKDPEVATAMGDAQKAGLWDVAKGRWKNTFKSWLVKKGYGLDTKVAQAMIRIDRFASEKRHEIMGTAVTEPEMQSAAGWMPRAGDSYQVTMAKMKVAESEGEEVFRRWLDIYKDTANMSPFYEAFGIERFHKTGGGEDLSKMSKEQLWEAFQNADR